MSRIVALLLSMAVMMASPTAAQERPGAREGSSFATIAQPADPAETLTARPNQAFFKFDARPVTAATLQDGVPVEIAIQFGAKAEVPFAPGRQLYGVPERPGLFCDLLRSRGLGLSAACLRDTDGDGRFDEGLRLDFNSGSGDVLLLTPSHKIIGVRFKAKPIPLPSPVRYAVTKPAADVTGKLALRWRMGSKRTGNADKVEMWVSTPENYTGTEGLSQRIVSFPRANAPLDLDFYGIQLHVAGFDEKGAMQVSVRGMTDGETVPLVFRGYVIYIIGY